MEQLTECSYCGFQRQGCIDFENEHLCSYCLAGEIRGLEELIIQLNKKIKGNEK